jgi:hypothetical protein
MFPRIANPARHFMIAIACSGALFVAACDDDEDDDDNDNATTVNATLDEFSITLDRTTAPAGPIRFRANNVGAVEHEFEIIRTDLAPNNLPTEANGSYDEDGAGTDLIDEIEDIEPGEDDEITLDLPAGAYVLICNMVVTQGSTVVAHYAQGMRVAFTVQ